MTDEEPVETFYTRERWQNWIDRIREEDLDMEDEETARLHMNLMEDTAIAVAKVVSAYDEGEVDEDRALAEIQDIQEIVLSEQSFEDEDKQVFVESIQMSLEIVFYAGQEYVAAGVTEEGNIEDYVRAAADAEQEEDVDAAVGYLVQAGTKIVGGEELDPTLAEDIEYGLVSQWVDGLQSLQSALSDPEVVEED